MALTYIYKSNRIQFPTSIFEAVRIAGSDSDIWDKMFQPTFLEQLFRKEYLEADVEIRKNEIIRYKLRRTKKRWANETIVSLRTDRQHPDIQSYMKKLKEIQKIEEQLPSYERFDLESRIDKMVEALQDWTEKDAKGLHEYPFFEQKAPHYQRSAMEVDTAILLGSELEKFAETYEVNQWINQEWRLPSLLPPLRTIEEVGLFKRTKDGYEFKETLGDVTYTHRYRYKNINIDIIREKRGNDVTIPLFSMRDVHLLGVISSFALKENNPKRDRRKENQLSLFQLEEDAKSEFKKNERTISFPLIKALKEMEFSLSSKGYRLLEKRLEKLTGLEIIKEQNGMKQTIKLFDELTITEGTPKRVNINVNPMLWRSWTEPMQSTSLTREEWSNLSPEAVSVLYWSRTQKPRTYSTDELFEAFQKAQTFLLPNASDFQAALIDRLAELNHSRLLPYNLAVVTSTLYPNYIS